jgi:hypothetical protein
VRPCFKKKKKRKWREGERKGGRREREKRKALVGKTVGVL